MNEQARSNRKLAKLRRLRSILILAGVALIMLGFGHRIERLSYQTYLQELELETTLQMVDLRERIEEEVFGRILKLNELATIISLNPEITQAEFAAQGRDFIASNPDVLSLAAARDQVISLVHPLQGNEKTLGYDYREGPQYPKVEEALRSGKGLATGPVELVQGGRGLILRQPVFNAPPIDMDLPVEPWGILSIVVDYQSFLDKLDVPRMEASYDLLIREPARSGAAEQVFLGDPQVSDQDPVTLPFNFAFGNWELAATTKGGWPTHRPFHLEHWLIRFAAVATVLSLLWYMMRLADTRRLAETRLHNGIEALEHGFVMFDPEGKLVLHNDMYKQMHADSASVKIGASYPEMVRESVTRGSVRDAVGREEAWLEEWATMRGQGVSDVEQMTPDGRIINTSDRIMEDGSIVGLRVDVSEFKKAQHAAEAANKAKSDFIGVLSHELRTPMTVILGHVRMAQHFDRLPVSARLREILARHPDAALEIRPALDDLQGQFARTMATLERSGNNLLLLINEILDLAKIDAGGLSIDLQEVEVNDIVAPVTDQLRPMVEQKGLTCELNSAPGRVLGDVQRLQQVLVNLIGNAVKFTDTGTITLSVESDDETITFHVRDTGIGIPQSDIAKVFEPFHQVDSTAARRFGGTGLGLAISQDIARAHGGQLTLSSTEGQGSVFSLSLPRLKPGPTAPARPELALAQA